MMTAITNYKPGDIILVPFPFTDLTAMKYRPAVVVSSSRFNRIQQDLIAAAITSNPYTEQGAYSYTLKKEECKRAGLFSPSAVKLGKIVTIDQRLVRKRIGILSSRSIIHIIAEVHKIIDKSGR